MNKGYPEFAVGKIRISGRGLEKAPRGERGEECL